MAVEQREVEHGRWTRAAPAVAAALLAGALFAVTLGGTYVYDDFDLFQLDNRLRDPAQWGRYWTESYNGGVDNLYRPLVSMTYALQWWLHGADAAIDESDAWKYHLVNVLLHACVSALVAELARRLAGARAAWIAGLLFAAHPVHVEAVANIVGRAELMCALGAVGALVLMLKPLTSGRAVAITGCVLVAVLSKEQGLLTPLLIFALAMCRRGERGEVSPTPESLGSAQGNEAQRRGAHLLLVVLLTWSLAAYIAWRERILPFTWDRRFLDWTINPLVRTDADRWLMPLALLGRYAALLVVPWKLSPDYGATVIGWRTGADDPYPWAGALALCAWLAALVVALHRRNGAVAFCLIAPGLTYAIVSNFPVLIGTIFGERLMYLPSVFFVILIAIALAKLPKPARVGLLAVVLALFCLRSFTYAARWNDRLRFYETSLREQPRSIRLYLLLTSEHLSRGEFNAAERLAREATEKLPDYWEVWIARANVAMEQGKLDEAERYLMTAVDAPPNPTSPTARIVRWMTLLEQKKAATRPSTAPARSS